MNFLLCHWSQGLTAKIHPEFHSKLLKWIIFWQTVQGITGVWSADKYLVVLLYSKWHHSIYPHPPRSNKNPRPFKWRLWIPGLADHPLVVSLVLDGSFMSHHITSSKTSQMAWAITTFFCCSYKIELDENRNFIFTCASKLSNAIFG